MIIRENGHLEIIHFYFPQKKQAVESERVGIRPIIGAATFLMTSSMSLKNKI